MNGPAEYARRVRASPYGPREVAAGGITAWFHGPFAVVTFTDAGGAITVRADASDALDGPSSGDDLVAFLVRAGAGGVVALPDPERLVCERPLVAGNAPGPAEECVLDLTARSARPGVLVTVVLSYRTIQVVLRLQDVRLLAEAAASWLSAIGRSPPSSS